MIKTTELRINNIVRVISGEIEIVESIGFNGVELKFIAYPIVDSGIEPIPLTPAVLEACGFERTPAYYMVKLQDRQLFSLDVYKSTLSTKKGIWWGGREIKKLHQLQNLVHVLTGQELQIDIEKLKNALK